MLEYSSPCRSAGSAGKTACCSCLAFERQGASLAAMPWRRPSWITDANCPSRFALLLIFGPALRSPPSHTPLNVQPASLQQLPCRRLLRPYQSARLGVHCCCLPACSSNGHKRCKSTSVPPGGSPGIKRADHDAYSIGVQAAKFRCEPMKRCVPGLLLDSINPPEREVLAQGTHRDI